MAHLYSQHLNLLLAEDIDVILQAEEITIVLF